MNSAENTFRTAVVGGFNRQDVLNYIESSAKEAKERSAALQKELEGAQSGRTAAEREAKELREQVSALKKEEEGLRATLAEKLALLDRVQSDLAKAQAEASALRERLGSAEERCAHWETGARAYDDLKDRTATIELEARQRARAIESAAEEQARKVRTAAEQILYQVQAGYGRLRGDVDATITHASGELGRVDRALEQVRAEFAKHDAALERLMKACRESVKGKEKQPQ